MSRIRQFRKIAASVVLGAFLLFGPTGYVLVRPGSAEDLSGFVTVEGGKREDPGVFYLVTVTQQSASPVLLLYALADPIVELRLRRNVIPRNMDRDEYNELMRRWMRESQDLAKVIALRRSGYEVPIDSDGVEVVRVEEESPARGILEPKDVILAVDGQEVFLAEELVSRVQQRPVGEPVELRIQRGEKELTVTIPTTTHAENPERAAIRVLIQTLNWQPELPVDIEIDPGEITGPSAGLMFVLEILNQLDPADLARGRKIAGTGTINLREQVGAIGGVRQKVRAAERKGAEFFFVPEENYEEAKPAARSIVLVPVADLSEALDFLDDIETGNR